MRDKAQITQGRGWRLAVTLLVSLLAWSAPAYAQTIGDGSAVDQYVEDVPTSEGSAPAGGSGNGGGGGTPVSPSVEQALAEQGDPTANLLNDVAANPAYGAPQGKLTQGREVRPEIVSSADPDDGGSVGSVVTAAASAFEGSDGRRLIGLMAALVLMTAATIGTSIRHRRRA